MHSHYGLEIEAMHSLYTAVGQPWESALKKIFLLCRFLARALESTFVLPNYT